MTDALLVEGLVKRFGRTAALSGLDLAARRGMVLGLLGPNGAGKTTVVRILATLLRPDGGRAMVAGHDVVRQPRRVRRLIGLTGQYASVDDGLTGTENLTLIGTLLDLRRSEARARAAQLLERFGLTEAAGRTVKTYSGGMRRRLDLAASLVGRPEIVFLDEPTTGLDPARREALWGVIRSLARDGVTVLLTTQYLEEADALTDEIAVINKGALLAHGTPAELKHIVGGQTVTVRPADPSRLDEVAAILHEVTGHAANPGARGVLTAPVDGDARFAIVVRRLSEAGIAATELALRLPSLDDVFFELTGHPVPASAVPDGGARAKEAEPVA